MVAVENLVKDYVDLRAVDGVSFQVKKGDILSFLGPDEAGKSTTMKMITAFCRRHQAPLLSMVSMSEASARG